MHRDPGRPGPSVLCGPAAREPWRGCCRPGGGFYGSGLAGETSGRPNFPLPVPGELAPADVTGGWGFPPRSPAPRVTAGENIQPRVGAVAAGRPPPPAHKGLSPALRQRGGSGAGRCAAGELGTAGLPPPAPGQARRAPRAHPRAARGRAVPRGAPPPPADWPPAAGFGDVALAAPAPPALGRGSRRAGLYHLPPAGWGEVGSPASRRGAGGRRCMDRPEHRAGGPGPAAG